MFPYKTKKRQKTMKFKFFIAALTFLSFYGFHSAFAQPGRDTSWTRGGLIGINLSQISLSNWAAGGDNAVGFNLNFNYKLDFKRNRHLWQNRLEMAYGLNKTKSEGTKKTNDNLYLSSIYGYQLKKSLYLSGLMTVSNPVCQRV